MFGVSCGWIEGISTLEYASFNLFFGIDDDQDVESDVSVNVSIEPLFIRMSLSLLQKYLHTVPGSRRMVESALEYEKSAVHPEWMAIETRRF